MWHKQVSVMVTTKLCLVACKPRLHLRCICDNRGQGDVLDVCWQVMRVSIVCGLDSIGNKQAHN